MADPRVENLAKILVHYSVAVKPSDWVLVRSSVLAMPLLKEVVRHIVRAGGHPTVILDDDDLFETEIKEAGDEHLLWVSPIDQFMIEKVNAYILLDADHNTRTMTGVDPQKMRTRQLARKAVNEIFFKRSAEGSLRWVAAQFPCHALAQDADMSLSEFEDFVYAATFSDRPDPVQAWQNVHNSQERLVQWLHGKDEVTVKGPHCDLKLSIAGRTFINSDGHYNMPCGEIFTGPVENSCNGWVHFTYPAVYGGREVEGVELEFKDGKVVQACAKKNEEFLLTLLDSDDGSRFLGEFAIGTNYGIQRFTRSILFDEKIGGSFHIAVGAGYPETGSLNKSSIHWDFICDMRQDSEIRVDGELFYKDGQFVV